MVIAVECFLLCDGGRGGKLIVVFLQGFLRFDHFYCRFGAGGGCILKVDCCVSCTVFIAWGQGEGVY